MAPSPKTPEFIISNLVCLVNILQNSKNYHLFDINDTGESDTLMSTSIYNQKDVNREIIPLYNGYMITQYRQSPLQPIVNKSVYLVNSCKIIILYLG